MYLVTTNTRINFNNMASIPVHLNEKKNITNVMLTVTTKRITMLL